MKILKQPHALFGLPAPNKEALGTMDRYLGQLVDSMESCNFCGWDRDVIELFNLLPQLFIKVGDRVEIPDACIVVLTNHLYVVYQAYLQERSPDCEKILLMSSEYAYHLLHLFKENPDYQPQLPAKEYKTALLLDPDWALRWCSEQHDKAFYPEIMRAIVKSKDINARNAFTYHRLVAAKLDRKAAVADVAYRLPLLLTDPEICLWLADAYPELERKQLFRSVFNNSVKTSYLLVWAAKYPEFDEQIRRELLIRPAWLADYIVRFNPPDARDLWLQAREKCSNQWLLPWIEQFGKSAGWF
jgi:hypothetical protein